MKLHLGIAVMFMLGAVCVGVNDSVGVNDVALTAGTSGPGRGGVATTTLVPGTGAVPICAIDFSP